MKRKSIRDKFLKMLLMFSLIPVVLFCFSMIAFITKNIIEKSESVITTQMQNQVDQMDKLLAQAYQIACTVAEDEAVNKGLSAQFTDDKERYASEISVNSELLHMSKVWDPSLKVYVIGENSGIYKSCPNSVLKDDYRYEEWYLTVKENMAAEWFEMQSISEIANTVDRGFISLAVPILNKQSGAFQGSVFVEVYVQDLLNQIEDINYNGEKYLLYPDADIRIDDEQVKIYDAKHISLVRKEDVENVRQGDRYNQMLETISIIKYWKADFPKRGFVNTAHYVVAYTQLDTNGWFVVYCVEKVDFYRTFKMVLISTTVVMVFLVLIAIFASYRISSSITKPITKLKESTERVKEGDFEISVNNLSNDEIGDLGIQFNEMVIEIRKLMNQIRIEGERQRQYELMLLQAQINPHFLYNTLDSLMWLIRMGDKEAAVVMLSALTRFFKTGLNQGKDQISIGQEIENVRSYLTIQIMRYQNKLKFTVQTEEELELYIIPKLILQPLVENAIYHGIKSKENGGNIKILCCRKGTDILLSVTDDGVGIEAGRLEELRQNIVDKRTDRSGSYGLTNVNERLQLYFKRGCSFDIESEPAKGTCVSIIIREENFNV